MSSESMSCAKSDHRNVLLQVLTITTQNNIDPWHLHDPESPLYFVMSRVKGFVSEIADRNATPFLHRSLYKDHVPQCILSCFSVSVLYTKRTPENTAMVMRAINSSVRELSNAEISLVMATPPQKLARTQALFMYQIIRLFDGDVSLRARGEKDMPLFRIWLSDLCEVRDNLGDEAHLYDTIISEQGESWEVRPDLISKSPISSSLF
jgi:hypothetical protein